MNKGFENIKASDELKSQTLKRAKGTRVRWSVISSVAAMLIIVLSVGFMLPGADKNEGKYDNNAPSYPNRDVSSSLTDTHPNKGDAFADMYAPEADESMPDYELPSATGAPGDSDISASAPEANGSATENRDLTASRLDDNLYFEEWLKDSGNLTARFGFDASKRIQVKVVDALGEPISNAKVVLYDGNHTAFTAYTLKNGVANLFYSWHTLQQYTALDKVVVTKNGVQAVSAVSASQKELTITLDTDKSGSNKLDIMFVIDATGSMGDELKYLKNSAGNMLKDFLAQNSARVSINFYRDEGDSYVVKSQPFVTELSAINKQLSVTEAGGGGDYPEAVHSALEDAINNHEWRDDAVKLVFLVLDAPAHASDAVARSLYETVGACTESGVRIVPVMSSGADGETERMCRELALLTSGQFVFLTDDSGIGNPHREPDTTIQYEVKPLITVLREVIESYIG